MSRPNWDGHGDEYTAADEVDYDATDDFARSIDVAYEAVRERVSKGGPGWTPKGGAK